MLGKPDHGHYNTQLLRDINAVCKLLNLSPRFPDVPDLQPDTGARFACQYFEQITSPSMGAAAGSAAAGSAAGSAAAGSVIAAAPPKLHVPSLDHYFVPTHKEFTLDELAKRRKREKVELPALDDDSIRALCQGCGVPFRDDSRELLQRGRTLRHESTRPMSERLCPPGLSQCCKGFKCSEKGGHQGRHKHLLSCRHEMARLTPGGALGPQEAEVEPRHGTWRATH